jgi:CheY-like chemotaxis protein
VSYVLLIEDDHDLGSVLTEVLEHRGFTVRAARNGAEALEVLREPDLPSVILLDLMMPVMNGWEFRYQQLSDPRLADIPTVIMSAIASQARNMGAVATLTKPVDVSTLLGILEPRFAGRPRRTDALHGPL